MKLMQKPPVMVILCGAVILGALVVAAHPVRAETAWGGEQAVQLAQAQEESSGEAESGMPAGQRSTPDRQRMGPGTGAGMMPGMSDGESGMMDPEMMMRMKRMHREMMGRMEPGMMGDSRMTGGMMGGMGPIGLCPVMNRSDKDLSPEQVRAILEGQIAWTGNKRLKVGAVEQKGEDSYVADIVTVDDSLVQRVEVDRGTGVVRPVD